MDVLVRVSDDNIRPFGIIIKCFNGPITESINNA